MARLSEFRVVLPRLRERQEDIPGLFRLFLKSACGGTSPALSAKLIEALCCHSWPLNVRELRNVARQAAVLHSHEAVLRASHLPPEVVGSVSDESDEGSVAAPIKRGAQRDLEDLDRLIEGLHRHDGHLGEACEFAKVSRQRAQRLLNRYPERDPRR
jgi:DNA-binding NtrC family response regulator